MGPLLKGMLTQGNEESTAQSASTFFWAVIDKKKARSQSQVRNLEGKYLIPGFWALRSKPWDKIWQAFPTPGNPNWNPNWILKEQERTSLLVSWSDCYLDWLRNQCLSNSQQWDGNACCLSQCSLILHIWGGAEINYVTTAMKLMWLKQEIQKHRHMIATY